MSMQDDTQDMETKRNLTGMATAPDRAAEMIDGRVRTVPSSDGDATAIGVVRVDYTKEGERIGSIPEPMDADAAGLPDERMMVFMDKLGERLAFERSGTRLYEALLTKHEAYGSWQGGPSAADIEHIHGEELEHFTMLGEVVRELGGDPTAVTPSANVHAVASKGLCAVLTDPRTTLYQCLEAMLTAELVDNDCWENLIDIARAIGKDDIADRFEEALDEEREHLAMVRRWIGKAMSLTTSNGKSIVFTAREQERDARAAHAEEVAAGEGNKKPPRRAAASTSSNKQSSERMLNRAPKKKPSRDKG